MTGQMPLATVHGVRLCYPQRRDLHSDYPSTQHSSGSGSHNNNKGQFEVEVTEFAKSDLLRVSKMSIDFIAGCLGGCAGVIVGHPLDTIKVHLQTQDPKNPRYKSIWHCMTTIVREERVRGLYRGITSPMAGIGMVNAIVFGIYGNVQRATSEPNSLYSHFLAGSVAGLLQSVVCAPMELAKTRMQLQSSRGNGGGVKHKGPLDCIRYIHRVEGIRGTFKGLGITAIRDVPGFAAYFVSYEYMMGLAHRPTAMHTLVAGGFAGIFSWLACYPTDVIKTCLQADGMSSKPQYTGIMDCARKGYQSEGYQFFVRGLASTLIRAFPMNAACFFVVSLIMQMTDGKLDMVVQSSSADATLNMLNVANMPQPPPHLYQQQPHQQQIKHLKQYQYQLQQRELEKKLGLIVRHKSSTGSNNYGITDGGGFTVDAGGGSLEIDAHSPSASARINGEKHHAEMTRRRLYLSRGLKALGVFNEAICLSEVEELAYELYPDKDYNNNSNSSNNSNSNNNNTYNNNTNHTDDDSDCYYYVYEDERIPQVFDL